MGRRCLITTGQVGTQSAYREWGLRPRAATLALQRALAVRLDEHLGGGQPRMAGERIREVKEEAGRQTGRGTGADSFTRRPRLAQGNADGGYARRIQLVDATH
mgnify:FL=1